MSNLPLQQFNVAEGFCQTGVINNIDKQ